MRFIVDECAGPAVSDWLESQGHDVFCIRRHARGSTDNQVIERALVENRILITVDKDFGEWIFRERRRHRGVVLLRLEDQRNPRKIFVLERLLKRYEDELADRFVTVTEDRIRFARRDLEMKSE